MTTYVTNLTRMYRDGFSTTNFSLVLTPKGQNVHGLTKLVLGSVT
jgi:hypothetical protein